jgi:hypothetical protein
MTPVVSPDEIGDVVRWLRSEIGVPFVVVGGSAIRIEIQVATKDVDVLISGRDWQKVDSAIENREDAAPLEPFSGSIRGTTVSIGDSAIQIDFLAGGPFGGDSFVEYVRGSGSRPYEGSRRARPEVVFYMRLCLDDWRENIPSIERDLRVGVPESTLDKAVSLAGRFGRKATLQERVAAVRQTIQDLSPTRE